MSAARNYVLSAGAARLIGQTAGMIPLDDWQPIETLPEHVEALVCVTHNVPAEEGDTRPPAGDGYVWETVMWTDWRDAEEGWFRYPRLIEIPFPPTHWMPLPAPPR